MKPEAEAAWRQGTACIVQSRFADAAGWFQRAAKIDPESAEIWGDLAAAEHQLGHLAAAEAAYRRSLSLKPSHLLTLANFGFLLSQTGRAIEVVNLLAPVLTSAPEAAQAWIVLGHAYWALNDVLHAEQALRQAVALAPREPLAKNNLAAVLRVSWKLGEAEQLSTEVVSKTPDYAEAWVTLGGLKFALGRPGEAIESYRRALAIRPDPQWHSNLLLAMQYLQEIEPARLKAAHEAWDAAHTRRWLPATRTPSSRRPDEPLRIGFVSAHMGRHPTAFLVLPVLEALHKSRCRLLCYSDRVVEDEYTARFQQAASVWRPTVGLTADELANQVRADKVDVLVDLMGHTGQRLAVFARKPAPLQVTWLGYVGTTGMSAMDGLIADSVHVTPGEEGFYCERVLRMPHGYVCYGPPHNAPQVSELPALSARHVTLGCFNNPAKFTPAIYDAWCEILRRVPTASLLIKFFGLDESSVRSRLSDEFVRRGISRERVTIEGQAEHHDFLASYSRVDLALDTQPYSGGLTTCEALWMGVPVVTFPGRTFAGRHAASHLTSAGLTHFIARNLPGYVDLAVSWARQPQALAAVRERMRQQVRSSVLCDAPRFANDFLQLLEGELSGQQFSGYSS